MSKTLEAPRPPVSKANRRFWMFAASFGTLSVIRGVDRIADRHLASGVLMLAGGAAMVLSFAWMLLRSRSARHPGGPGES
jgi:hypothetical protein